MPRFVTTTNPHRDCLLTSLLAFSLLASVAAAAPPAPAAPPAQDHAALTSILRALLLKNLPDPLIETTDNWGHRKDVVVGFKLEKQGTLRWHAVPQTVTRNDGHWQKVRVQAIDPDKSVELTIANMRTPEPGKSLFDAMLKVRVRMTYEQQVYVSGARLLAGETRASCLAELKLVVELTDRIEFNPGNILPSLAFRVRVVQAELTYSDLVCEHTFGLGGDAAKVIGNVIHEFIKKVKPNLETDLLAKANTAIVKAADTKEVKVEFGKMLKR